jgi:hypothetical protein
MVIVDGVLNWRLDLLTTITQHSWLHLFIAPSLTSTLYKSLQHMLSLFGLLCLHQSLPGYCFKSGDSSASMLNSLPTGSQMHRLSLLFTDSLTTLSELSLKIWWTSKPVPVIASQHGPCRKHHSLFYSNCFYGTCLSVNTVFSYCSHISWYTIKFCQECNYSYHSFLSRHVSATNGHFHVF